MHKTLTSAWTATATALACTLAASASHAAPTTVFSDGFEAASLSGWQVSSSAGVTAPVAELRSDSVHSGSQAMWTYFDAPSGGTGANTVYATHSFDAFAMGDYTLSLWARSAPCGGCTMHFDVLIDGVLLARDGTAPNDFVERSFVLAGLSAGTHTLTLGMYTDGAASGRFQATFDDVLITTDMVAAVPEPGTLPLLVAGLGFAGWLGRRRGQR